MRMLFPLTLISALILSACYPSVPDDGKGLVTLDFSSSAQSRSALRSSLRTTFAGIPVTDTAGNNAGTITITDAWVVIKEIEFEHESDDEEADVDESKLEFTGPFALDLLTGTTYPSLPQISIDTGIYNDIEIE